MKRSILAVILVILLLVTIPLGLWAAFRSTEDQYTATYYGVLKPMYDRLKEAEGKRIILVGGSAMAFGLNVSFLEAELEGYTICPFGLYGTIGTKAMLELAKPYLREGDILILSPEVSQLPLSLYFSSDELWKAAESDLSMVANSGDIGAMLGSFPEYVADRFAYTQTGSPSGQGVYAAASFDENCQMIYPREYNTMPALHDPDEPVTFDPALLTEDFLEYLNNYYRYCYGQGTTIYYNFCPINRMAVSGDADISGYYEKLLTELDFPVLGDPNNYILDAEWFYDSNFHVNTAGALVYTAQLTEDIKSVIGDTSPTPFEMPDKPIVPIATTDGDNRDAHCFTYEVLENGIRLTGLTEEGKKRTSLVLPSLIDGLPVIAFSPDVFRSDIYLEEVTIPATIRSIQNSSFFGCSNLQRIILTAPIPNCSVGTGLLDGCQNARIIVPDRESYLTYIVNYYWAQYASRTDYLQ